MLKFAINLSLFFSNEHTRKFPILLVQHEDFFNHLGIFDSSSDSCSDKNIHIAIHFEYSGVESMSENVRHVISF